MGNLTAGKVFSTSLYPSTILEKGQLVSTSHWIDRRLATDETALLSELDAEMNDWNPMLLYAVPDGCRITALISL